MTGFRRSAPIAVLAAVVALPAVAFAHSYKLQGIDIGHIWAPPAEKGEIVSVFVPIFNTTDVPVTLTRISGPEAERIGICKGGDGTVEWQDTATIAPGKVLAMAKWREHICIEGMGGAEDGESFPLTLTFGDKGSVETDVLVEAEGSH